MYLVLDDNDLTRLQPRTLLELVSVRAQLAVVPMQQKQREPAAQRQAGPERHGARRERPHLGVRPRFAGSKVAEEKPPSCRRTLSAF